MTKPSLIQPDQGYTFSDYFKLNGEPEEIFGYFGYSFRRETLTLPQVEQPPNRLAELKSRIEESLPHISLTSEMARREFLIAPIVMELIHYTQVKVKVEYNLAVNDQLKGSIDYYLQAQQPLLIIEAKNADLEKGFVQLGTELIAVDIWSPTAYPVLYGAVSIGNIWQFGILERDKKLLIQDLNLYRVPADIEVLFKTLTAILNNGSNTDEML